jgi:YHS domain-containing protein
MLLRFILLAVLILIIARLFWRLVDGVLEGATGRPRGRVKDGVAGRRSAEREGVKLVRDPVCGTFVAPGDAPSLTTGGQTLYFCSAKCRGEYKGA